MLSTTNFYLKTKEIYWKMRTSKWDPWFEPEVEMTTVVAWIFLPNLPLKFCAKNAIFSIAL